MGDLKVDLNEKTMEKYLMIKRYALLGFILIFILSLSRLPKLPSAPFNIKQLGALPVLHDGRVKPLNSALTSIVMMIREKQYVKTTDGQKHYPLQWFFTLITDPTTAHDIPIFLIDHPQVKALINHSKDKKKVFSINDIHQRIATIYSQSEYASQTDAHKRNSFQRDIIQLQQKITLYLGLQASVLPVPEDTYASDLVQFNDLIPQVLPFLSNKTDSRSLSLAQNRQLTQFIRLFQAYKGIEDQAIIRFIPPLWESTGQHILHHIKSKQPIHPLISSLAQLLDAYKNNHHRQFNTLLKDIDTKTIYGNSLRKTVIEHYFVLAQPFFLALILYLFSLLLIFLSYIRFPTFFRQITSYCFKSAFFLHTIGLVLRIYISGRPPVTNLYSSAVFIGWVAIIVALLLEKRFKNTLGLLVSTMIGFSTLIIAHHLSFQGDTMAMMQAVLDSNFWLSTHVITVTMGYSGTFLAGFLAIIFIVLGIYTKKLTPILQKQLYSMVFGVTCFGLLFSFIGTVLGGIWADQSWGRFWGWDPKENGALLIVIWLAIMLHARIGGFIKEKGFMVMAVFGNIVTSFSWFGVNMLGIGLHSYGFMDSAFMWLTLFIVSQLFIMGIGMLPHRYWKS
jgi:ABC-type transport system involved in cytochrome c biogenesis permease subunit